MVLKKLFEPLQVGNLTLKNRLVMIGIGGFLAENCRVTERLKAFDGARASGGTGLIIRGNVHPGNIGPEKMPGIWDDGFIPGLRDLTDFVHKQGDGVMYACQISTQHVWRRSPEDRGEAVGPSDVVLRRPSPSLAKMIEVLSTPPRPLTIAEIEQITDEYGDAVRRAREANFDTVEIMAGMGYLVSRFLSKLHNKRTDRYGGSVEKRARFLLDIIANAQKKAGNDYPIIVRFLADEFLNGGNTLEEGVVIAQLLEKAGVALLDVQVGTQDSSVPVIQSVIPQGSFVHYSESIKKAVNIPVLTGIRISDPVFAEQILAEGKSDLIGMARSLVADPDLPNKAREGRLKDIRPCILCCHCLDVALPGNTIRCAINAQVGRESEYRIESAEKAKKVVIIGSGIAGMEAARVSALRGHRVTLFERADELGGQLLLAGIPPFKSRIDDLVRYLIGQVKASGVQVKLGTKVTAKAIEEMNPDVVIIATGAKPIIPKIAGIEGDNIVSASDVLNGSKGVGDEIIIVGGGMVGCETADFLAQRGKKVTILEMLGRIGQDIGAATRWVIIQRLRKAGVQMETKTEVAEITPEGVRVKGKEASAFFKGDTVVLAVGFEPNTRLAEQLITSNNVPVIHLIGDCVEPRKIVNATEEAFRVAMRL
jgi:2,4-dienoyl-CoA reductase-like NADH-dependent reductase (Old Yellow Enzyme family)/thioredoxin reductase